jgi:hypothetical protein
VASVSIRSVFWPREEAVPIIHHGSYDLDLDVDLHFERLVAEEHAKLSPLKTMEGSNCVIL